MTGERWEDKVNRMAKELALMGFTVMPTIPKGIFGPRCQRCQGRTLAGSGKLIDGRCGACARLEEAA